MSLYRCFVSAPATFLQHQMLFVGVIITVKLMHITLSSAECGRGEGTRIGTAGSHRGESQRKRERSAEGPIRADQGNRPRARAAQERGGHPAFQSSHVRYGQTASGDFHIHGYNVLNYVFEYNYFFFF